MKKRQIVTAGIALALIAAVFFLNAIISSDKGVESSIIIPIFTSLPFVLVAGILIYFSGDRNR
jgi:hypothetical protein